MVDNPVTGAQPQRYLSTVPYMPGLDGMRALAVAGVMLYHANSSWMPGGYLGVEVFFVISGYLITLLLMAERERTGRVSLTGFWLRRARRLMPALYVMLVGLLVYTVFFRADTLGMLRGDLLAALAYVSNWYQLWVGQGYTAPGEFAPLRHLWSLAVEEQYYLVWPVVMAIVLRAGTRQLANTAAILFGAAVAINVMVAVLYYGGRVSPTCGITPDAYWTVGERCISSNDTLYLSTISRSGGLMLGAAFAMIWRPVSIMRGPLRDAGRRLDLGCLVGLAGLGALMWFVPLSEPFGKSIDVAFNAWLFRGGLFLTGVATLVVVAAVTHRYSMADKLLGNPVLRYVGTRSYGLYLFHWPIYQIIRDTAGAKLTLPQFAFGTAITVAITELSYTYVETPIRRGQVARRWASLRDSDPALRQIAAVAAVVALLLGAFGVYRLTTAELIPADIAQTLEDGEGFTTDLDDLLDPDTTEPNTTRATTTTTSTVVDGSVGGAVVGDTTATTSTTPTATPTTAPPPREPVRVLGIGDSVMQGAADVLEPRGWTVVAEQGLQMVDAVPMVQSLVDGGVITSDTAAVIVHLGTNGTFSAETLDALLAPLSIVPNVLLYTIRADRSWTATNNALLRARDRPGDNIVLIDWAQRAAECSDNCFAGDGIHLNANGKIFYANLARDWTGV